MAKNDNLKDLLTDVANAIRTKKGTIGLINPQDFSAEIASIEGGGSSVVIMTEGDVNFYDYDGTLLYAYTKEEFAGLTEMPAIPEKEGFTSQGWNWDLSEAKAYVSEYGKLDVGATYITDDGKTRFYIKVEGDRKSFPFKFYIDKANSLVIDWGDGSATESISGSGRQNVSHIYDAVGDYVISLDVAEGATLSFGGNSASYATISKPYTIMLRKAEIGERASIGNYAFSNCHSLSSVVLPSSVTSIGSQAFYLCYSLPSIVIPNSVTSIGGSTFYKCSSLTSVVLPNSVTSIGDSAFYNCYSLTSVVLPNSLTSIGGSVFSDCSSLSSVVIPQGVTSIGSSAFYNCHSLSSLVIPNSMTSIGGAAFYGCFSLSSIVIPNGVTSIGSSAFYTCSSLSSVVISSSVTSIGSSAFYSCYSLTSVVIPSSVTSIEKDTFKGCTSLYALDFRNHTSVLTLSDSSAFSSIASDCKFVVPDELYDEWIAATNWASQASKIVKASEYNG
jgi:hypothetical protein